MHGLPDQIGAGEIRLRRAVPADAGLLFALFNAWNVVQWLARPSWPLSFAETNQFLNTVNRGPGSAQYWVIERNSVMLGGVSGAIEPASDRQSAAGPHIGYWLGEPFWGQGVMTRAASLFCAAIFADVLGDAIYSGVFAENGASLRVQRKLGFVVEGQGMQFCTPQGRRLPHLNTVLRRTDFRPVPA